MNDAYDLSKHRKLGSTSEMQFARGYAAGHAAARAEAEALLRECRRTLTDVYPFHATPAILDRIDAYLAGGGRT